MPSNEREAGVQTRCPHCGLPIGAHSRERGHECLHALEAMYLSAPVPAMRNGEELQRALRESHAERDALAEQLKTADEALAFMAAQLFEANGKAALASPASAEPVAQPFAWGILYADAKFDSCHLSEEEARLQKEVTDEECGGDEMRVIVPLYAHPPVAREEDKDRERLDWLEAHIAECGVLEIGYEPPDRGDWSVGISPSEGGFQFGEEDNAPCSRTLRTTIDAARASLLDRGTT